MQKRRMWQYTYFLLLAVSIFAVGTQNLVRAEVSTSPSYQVMEMDFNAGGILESCSGQYCATASIGNITTGQSESSNYTTNFSTTTTSEDPLLEVIVDPGQSDLGVLTTEKTASKSMIVRIRSYLSGGYVLQIMGDAPKYNNHTLHTPTTPTASTPGVEQFALNAVKNTTPVVGEDPAQVPSGDVSFGSVEEAYNTPNLFQYISGDVVASSQSDSGRTDYTISMIINISNSTPAGHYTGDFAAVVIPGY